MMGEDVAAGSSEIGRHHQGVMRQPGVAAADAEIHEEGAAAVAQPLGPRERLAEQRLVNVGKVGVRQHQIGGEPGAVRQADPGDPPLLPLQRGDLGPVAEAHADLARELRQGPRERVHAAAREVEPAGDLGIGEQAVDGRRLERREPEIQALETERVPKLVAAEEPGDQPFQPMHGAAPEQEQGIPEAQEIATMVDVPVYEPVEADAIEPSGHREKPEQLGPGTGLDPLDLPEHRIEPAGDVEGAAVRVVHPVVGLELNQVEIGAEPPPDVMEERLEVLDHEEEGRAGVEAEPRRLPEPATPPGHGVTLEHGDLVAPMAKADRGGEAAQSGTDHQDLAALARGLGAAEGRRRGTFRPEGRAHDPARVSESSPIR